MEELVFGNENIYKETFINKRIIICKSCSEQFNSFDVKCFEYNKERVRVFCPKCKTENLILKKKVVNSDE